MDWATASQEQRDLAYNNNTAVPDAAALIAERAAASALMAPPLAAMAFGETEREAWDLWPASDPTAPILAFIHGGYWQRNRRQDFWTMAEGALAMGWGFAVHGYSLAPEASLTQITWQVHAALDWLSAHGGQHGMGGPIVLSGWSAGGHLTAMGAEHPAVAAGLAISGIFELGPIRDTYLNEKLGLTDEEILSLSPIRRPVVHKPIAIAYGSAELPELCRQSRDFHAMRAAAHAPGPLLPVAAANHFTILEALRRPGGALLRAAAELLR
ncbi:MAG: alpha/beta hydrolase [Alphaproteobacteria bacterium]|nr:alpha/beta hydrolase [Alphaproteobacteria bacterium]